MTCELVFVFKTYYLSSLFSLSAHLPSRFFIFYCLFVFFFSVSLMSFFLFFVSVFFFPSCPFSSHFIFTSSSFCSISSSFSQWLAYKGKGGRGEGGEKGEGKDGREEGERKVVGKYCECVWRCLISNYPFCLLVSSFACVFLWWSLVAYHSFTH